MSASLTISKKTKTRTNNPKKLDCWTPSFQIPQFLIDRAYEIKLYQVSSSGRLQGQPEMYSWRYPKVLFDIIVTDGYFQWHDDKHYPSEFSCALILRNDVPSWIEVAGQPIVPQAVGQLVSLNIHCKHRQNCPGGIKGEPGVWVGLMRDSKEFKTREEWETIYQKLFEAA